MSLSGPGLGNEFLHVSLLNAPNDTCIISCSIKVQYRWLKTARRARKEAHPTNRFEGKCVIPRC